MPPQRRGPSPAAGQAMTVVQLDVLTVWAARDAVLVALKRARQLAHADARYRVTVARHEATLKALDRALGLEPTT